MIGLHDKTYLTMPKPRLMMTTSMRASALFMHDTSSANTTAPGTTRVIEKVESKIHEHSQHLSFKNISRNSEKLICSIKNDKDGCRRTRRKVSINDIL